MRRLGARLLAAHAAVLASASSSTAPSTPQTLRLVSFNIHAWRDAQHLDNLPGLIELLRGLQPDVVCLNEVLHPFVAPPADDPYWDAVRQRKGYGYTLPPSATPTSSGGGYLERLAEALGMEHVAFAPASTRGFFGRVPFGNGILSRHAFASVERHVMCVEPSDLTLGEQPRTPDDLEDRSVLLAAIELPGELGVLGVASTHLDHRAEEMREKQMRACLGHCARFFGGGDGGGDDGGGGGGGGGAAALPFVLCGDLNSFDRRDMDAAGWRRICDLYASRGWPPPTPHSLVRAVLEEAGLVDSFALRAEAAGGHDAVPPPTSWTDTRIDYVLLRAGGGAAQADAAEAGVAAAAAAGAGAGAPRLRVGVRAHATLTSCAVSDHVPLVVDFEVSRG